MGSNPTPSASYLVFRAKFELVLRLAVAERLDRFQAAQNFGKEELIFKVYPIIEIGPEPVLLALAVLRHHDDGRLQTGYHAEDEI